MLRYISYDGETDVKFPCGCVAKLSVSYRYDTLFDSELEIEAMLVSVCQNHEKFADSLLYGDSLADDLLDQYGYSSYADLLEHDILECSHPVDNYLVND